MDKGISHVLSMSILLYGLQRPIFNSQDKEPYSFVGLKAQEKTGLLLMPTAKVTKNVSAAEGGGNVLCSILISIKTKAWLYSFLSPLRKASSRPKKNGAWSVPSCELSPLRVAHIANRPSPRLSCGGTIWNDRSSVPLI